MTAVSTPSWPRRAAGLAVVWLPAVVLLVMGPVWLPRLPALTASHWPGIGLPDGFTASGPFWVVTTVIAVVVAIVATVVVVATRDGAGTAGWWALLGGAYGTAIAAAAWLVSASVTLRAGSAEEAVLGAGLLGLGAAGVYPLLVFLVAGRPRASRPDGTRLGDPESSAVTRALPAPAVSEASATITSQPFVWLAVSYLVTTLGILVLVILVPGEGGGRWGAGIALLTMLVFVPWVVGLARITVTADSHGLWVRGWGGFPISRTAAGRIAAVRAEQINPWDWGGWGIRWVPGRTAVVIRGGPGVVVERTNGTWFAVTVDDAEVAAVMAGVLEVARVAAEGRKPNP